MIDFSAFIGSLITIIVCYITLNETKKKQQRKNLYIRIILLFLGAIVTFLYFFHEIKYITLSIILPALKKMFPFNFPNGNFKFSFFTETVLMIITILLLIFLVCICSDELSISSDKIVFIISITLSFPFIIGLIWLNVFLSNFLCFNIFNHFYRISLFFNIGVYCAIWFLLIIFTFILIAIYDKIKEAERSKKS